MNEYMMIMVMIVSRLHSAQQNAIKKQDNALTSQSCDATASLIVLLKCAYKAVSV